MEGGDEPLSTEPHNEENTMETETESKDTPATEELPNNGEVSNEKEVQEEQSNSEILEKYDAVKKAANSIDNEVEHFFEGLDEEDFIADLQVVSSWEGGASRAEGEKANEQTDDQSPQTEQSKPRSNSSNRNKDKTAAGVSRTFHSQSSRRFKTHTNPATKWVTSLPSKLSADKNNKNQTDKKSRVIHQESALSRFKSFMEDENELDYLEKKYPDTKENFKKRKSSSSKYDSDSKRKDDKERISSRRDPDKTKRDIERDKVNKTKETLIKKMESGLIPPGMEMENQEKTSTEESTKENKLDRKKRSLSKSSPEVLKRRARSPRFSRRSSLNRHRSRSSNRSGERYRSPNFRTDFSPTRYRRYRMRMREEEADREYRKKRDTRSRFESYSHFRRKYKSRSKETSLSPHSRSSRSGENFLTYLSKNNLISPQQFDTADRVPTYSVADTNVTYTMTTEMNPQSPYIATNYISNYVDNGLVTQGVPPPMMTQIVPPPLLVSSIPQGVPPPLIEMNNSTQFALQNSYYTEPPPISYVASSVTDPTYTYSNGYVNYDTTAANLETPAAYNTNDVIQQYHPADPAICVTETSPTIIREQEEKDRIIKNCENVLKKLNKLRVPSCISLQSEEDAKQRECSFSEGKQDVNYVSPLNRNSSTYTFTSTGQRNRLIVPTLISTLEADGTSISTPKVKPTMRDFATQTSDFHCDRCQLKDKFNQDDRSTSTFGLLLTKSTYSQVEDCILASSKMLFTPNQNLAPEPQKPISLTHMTPSQILVNELAIRTKNMQRSAVDNFRQAGGNLEDSKKYNPADHFKSQSKDLPRWKGKYN